MATVLDAASKNVAQDFATARMLAQMQEAHQQRSTERQEQVSASYQSKINQHSRELDKWRALKKDIGEASSDISRVLGRAKSVVSKLDSLISTVNKANTSEDGGSSYAAAYDSILKSLEKDVTDASKVPNLLGRTGNTLNYPTSIYGATESVTGGYLGNDYHIIDSEGKRWVPDRDKALLRRYDSYPETESGLNVSMAQGLRLDSLTGTDITFTIYPDSLQEETRTGTLTREGTEVVDSWFYGNLGDEDGRTRALADLNDAKEAAAFQVRHFEIAYRVAKFYEDRANAELSGLRDKVNEQEVARAQAIGEEQAKLNAEFQAASGRIAQAMSLRRQYQNLFSSLGGSNVAKSLFSITA